MHRVDALQGCGRDALGDHVRDEGIENGHFLIEAHLLALLQECNGIAAKLSGLQIS